MTSASTGLAIGAVDTADQSFFNAAGPMDYLGSGFPWTASWHWFGLVGIRRIEGWVIRVSLIAAPPEPRQEGTGRISSSQVSATPTGTGYDGIRIDISGADGAAIHHDLLFRQTVRRPDGAMAAWDPRLYQTIRGWVWFDRGAMRHISGSPRLSDTVDLAEDLIAISIAGRPATAAVRSPAPLLAAFQWDPGWLWWQNQALQRVGQWIVRVAPVINGVTPPRPAQEGTGTYSRSKPVGLECSGMAVRMVSRGGSVVEHVFAFADYLPRPTDASGWEPRLFETVRGVTWFDNASMRSLGATIDTSSVVAAVESFVTLVAGRNDGAQPAAAHQHSGGYTPDELLVITGV